MKFHTLVSAVAGVAVCTTSASAQMCQGDLSFRGGQKHVGAALNMADNSTSLGGGLTVGHSKGWFGGASLGMASYDGIDSHSLAVGGGIGYAMPLANKSRWQMCPGASLSLGFGPNFDVGGTKTEMSSQTMALGLSLGTAVRMNKTFNVLPFGSAALAHTRASIKANGTSASGSDNYMVFGMGAGLQFSPSLVVRPSLSLLADNDANADDTIFGLSLTWAVGH
jgi:outer membrane protein with beta-barrel domain